MRSIQPRRRLRVRSQALLPLFLLSLVACGGEAPAPKTTPPPTVKVEAPAPAADATPGAPAQGPAGEGAPASVHGVVSFDGVPPARKPLAFGGVQGCNLPGGTPPLSETLLVNDGRVENCIVYISKGLPRSYEAPPPPAAPVEFDQKGCVYSPHVAAVRAGQKLVFHNEDATSHNVHVFSKYKGFNKTQPANGQDIDYVFERAEPPVQVGCDIHPWMRAWVGVFDDPFFAVTGADGSFSIEGIPPGSYELVCWHEQLGKKTARLELPAGARAEVGFTLSE